jgi:hypothetical protein
MGVCADTRRSHHVQGGDNNDDYCECPINVFEEWV